MSTFYDHDSEFENLLQGALRAWQEEDSASGSAHPQGDLLLAYQEGRLTDEEADAIRRHVVACPTCQDDLQALSAFDELPDAEVEAETEVALEEGWTRFAQQRAVQNPSSRKALWKIRPEWLPLAASILFAVIGVASFLSLGGGPGSHPMVLDLLPDGSGTERGREGSNEFQIPQVIDHLVPRVQVGDQTPYERFELVLEGNEGQEIVRLDGAVRDSLGRFALTVPRAEAPQGDYRLLLFGIEGERRIELAVYSFRLRDAG